MTVRVSPASGRSASYELKFCSLVREREALSVPCDARGRVDLDALDEPLRSLYLFARFAVGGQYGSPVVCSVA